MGYTVAHYYCLFIVKLKVVLGQYLSHTRLYISEYSSSYYLFTFPMI